MTTNLRHLTPQKKISRKYLQNPNLQFISNLVSLKDLCFGGINGGKNGGKINFIFFTGKSEYIVRSLLGEGAFGKVFLAYKCEEEANLGGNSEEERVALKVFQS